jgi:hypothetical protein
MSAVPHKRGASFLAQVTATALGEPLDLTSLTITSQLRTRSYDPSQPGTPVVPQAEVTVVDAPAGRFDIAQDNTSAWPVAMLEWDIRIVDADGKVSLSETVTVNCAHEVTR